MESTRTELNNERSRARALGRIDVLLDDWWWFKSARRGADSMFLDRARVEELVRECPIPAADLIGAPGASQARIRGYVLGYFQRCVELNRPPAFCDQPQSDQPIETAQQMAAFYAGFLEGYDERGREEE